MPFPPLSPSPSPHQLLFFSFFFFDVDKLVRFRRLFLATSATREPTADCVRCRIQCAPSRIKYAVTATLTICTTSLYIYSLAVVTVKVELIVSIRVQHIYQRSYGMGKYRAVKCKWVLLIPLICHSFLA